MKQASTKAARQPLAFLVFIFIVFTIGLYFNAGKQLADPDTGWHIAAGDQILSTHAIPQTDSFSHTTEGYIWYNISWLWDIVASFIHGFGGLEALVIFNTLLGAANITLLAYLCMRKQVSLVPLMAALLIGACAYLPTLTARPHTVSFLLMLCMIWCAEKQSEKNTFPLVLLQAAIMMLWANIHGAFLAGFTVLGAYGLAALHKRDQRLFLAFAGTGVLCVAATLINPVGWQVYLGAARTLSSSLKVVLQEWQPSFIAADNWLHMIYPALFLLCLIPFWRSFSTADKILGGFWLVAGLSVFRYLPFFVVVSLPAFARGLSQALRKADANWANTLMQKSLEYEADLSGRKARNVLLGVAAFVVATMFTPPVLKLAFPQGAAIAPDLTPNEAITWIDKKYACLPMINMYNYGGAIVYQTHGRVPVFIDGRAETAYPPQVIQDFLTFQLLTPDLPEMLKRRNIQLALVATDTGNHRAYFEKLAAWQLVFEKQNAAVFVRRDVVSKKCKP